MNTVQTKKDSNCQRTGYNANVVKDISWYDVLKVWRHPWRTLPLNSRKLVLTKFRGDFRVSCTKQCMPSNGESLLYRNLTFIWEMFLKRRTLIFRNCNQNPQCNKPLRRNSNSVSCQAPNRKRAKLLGNVVLSLTSMCGTASTSVKVIRKYCLRSFSM